MRALGASRTSLVPGGVLAGPWVRNDLWRRAQAVPSLDLRFADNKSLVDAVTGASLVTFTRDSNGTFVGSDGVLRRAVTNLLLRSEEPSNVIWGKDFITVTAAAAIAPNGTTTANKVAEDSSNNFHVLSQYVTGFASGAVVILSIYVKAAGRTRFRIQTDASGGVGTADFDLLAGTATAGVGVFSNGLIVNAGNDWYRCSVRCTTSGAGAIGLKVILVQSAYGVSYTGDGTSGLFLWGAQLEQSTTVSEYIPTTSTINSAPRFDHNPETGESLGLLVEEQRTNSIRNNTGVGAVAGTPGTLPTNWSQANNTGLVANVVGTGTENGITYIDFRVNGTTTGTGQTNIVLETVLGVAAATGQVWSLSSYFKIQAGSLANVSSINLVIQENNAAGAAVTAGAQAITIPASSLGVYRPTFTRTLSGGVTVAAAMPYIQININTGLAVNFTLRIGLPQLEQGAFATSPIPTTTAAATRSADVASITGSAFSGWYRQDEGTMFALAGRLEGASGGTTTAGQLDDGTTTNRILVGIAATGVSGQNIGVAITSNVQEVTFQAIAAAGGNRVALAYALNNYGLSLNGATPLSDTSAAIPAGLANLRLGNNTGSFLSGHIRRLCYWPQRLGNQVLQSITQ